MTEEHTPGPWRWFFEPSSHSLDHPRNAPDVEWDGIHDERGEPYDEKYGLDFDALRGPDGDCVLYGVWHNDDTAGVGVDPEDARLIERAWEIPEIVAQRDALLESAKAAREFFGKHPAISGGIFAIELARKLDAAITKTEDDK